MHDDKGYTDHITLHQGTIINPTGIKLLEGMKVTDLRLRRRSDVSSQPRRRRLLALFAVLRLRRQSGVRLLSAYGGGYGDPAAATIPARLRLRRLRHTATAIRYGGLSLGINWGWGWGWGWRGYWVIPATGATRATMGTAATPDTTAAIAAATRGGGYYRPPPPGWRRGTINGSPGGRCAAPAAEPCTPGFGRRRTRRSAEEADALHALAPIDSDPEGSLPERAFCDQEVENRPESPDDADDEPDDLLKGREVAPREQVHPHEDHRDRVQDDREQNLQQQLHRGYCSLHRFAAFTRYER